MFEHLGPLPDIKTKNKPKRFKAYGAFLLLLVAGFFVFSAVNVGPKTQAAKPDAPNISLFVDQTARQVVAQTPQMSVFSLLVKSSLPVDLQHLKISANGLYDKDIFAKLKLYNGGVQIGQISSLDTDGNIYFDLNSYPLPAGDNVLDLVLSDSSILQSGDILQFSLADDSFLSINYQGKHILAKADWPLSGGTITILPKGVLSAYNNSKIASNIILSQGTSTVVDFSLAANAETVDLGGLRFIISPANDLSEAKFILRAGQEELAIASADNNELNFILDKKLVVTPQEPVILSLAAEGLLAGDYDFTLAGVSGVGFVSGQDIVLDKSLSLGTSHVQDNFLQFSNLPVDKKLTLGWNLIYNFKVKSLGQAKLAINKLTWQVNRLDLDIIEAKLSVDGQTQAADIIIKDDKIIAKMAANQLMYIDNNGSEVRLLVRIDRVNKNSRLESYLLADQTAPEQDIWLSNILWSLGDQMHSGYLLAGLPLDPQVLDN